MVNTTNCILCEITILPCPLPLHYVILKYKCGMQTCNCNKYITAAAAPPPSPPLPLPPPTTTTTSISTSGPPPPSVSEQNLWD